MIENELKNKAYNCAVAHGWHEEEMPDQHWLMMIITEVAEAVQADRKGRRAQSTLYEDIRLRIMQAVGYTDEQLAAASQRAFEQYIKDTVEDEIADIFIRCYDFAGLKDWDIDTVFKQNDLSFQSSYRAVKLFEKPFTAFMHTMTLSLTLMNTSTPVDLCRFMYRLGEYCGYWNIDILTFIRLKMDYNETRPYKHDRRY